MAEAMVAAGVVIVGIREFSKRTSAVIDAVEETQTPAVITRHGRPVATIIPRFRSGALAPSWPTISRPIPPALIPMRR